MSLLDYPLAFWISAQANLDLFGALGLMFGFITSLMPRRQMILITSTACGLCFGLHYLHLGSATGTAMATISVVQSLLALCFITDHRRPAWLNPIFAATMALVAGLTLATWNGLPSAFAGAGALLATAARLQASSQAMRWLLLCATLCCAGHNTLVGSVCGLTCDVLAILGFLVTLARSSLLPYLPKFRVFPAV